jgi:uncharacterized DUF497 family protein
VERLAVDHSRAAAAEAWSMLVLVWRWIVFFRCGPAYLNATGHGLLIRRLVEYLEGTIMEVQNEFEWDGFKARQNAKRYGVRFERAATVFLDSNALSLFDEQHSEDEDRWITLGLDRTGALLVVSHTFREQTPISARVRLISARKPTRTEVKQYERK